MHRPPSLILASQSPYKRRLFGRLGIDFEAKSPAIDERRRDGESAPEMARRLAIEKAQALAADHPDAFIIGSDQVIALEEQLFQKPGTPQRAIDQLQKLQGKTHRLINSVALYPGEETITHSTTVYEMVMRPLSIDQIQSYVAEDNPIDCAGSYRIESAGIRLFEATRGDDPTAIEGIPLTRVWTLLLKAGWPNG